jgi:hypothetical protein
MAMNGYYPRYRLYYPLPFGHPELNARTAYLGTQSELLERIHLVAPCVSWVCTRIVLCAAYCIPALLVFPREEKPSAQSKLPRSSPRLFSIAGASHCG